MALDTGSLMDATFANVVKAEDFAFAAWSGAVTVALSVGYFGNGTITEAVARRELQAEADRIGINKNTWQAYVGAMFKAADKLGNMAKAEAAGMVSFHAIADLDTDDAIANVELLLRGLGMETGGHIRDWTKQEGLAPFNPSAAKAARKDTKAAPTGLLRANRGHAPGTVSDTATTAAPASGLADILAAIANLGHADTLAAMAALNDHMAALDAKVATAPAPTLAPVLADDATVAKLSTLGRVRHAA